MCQFTEPNESSRQIRNHQEVLESLASLLDQIYRLSDGEDNLSGLCSSAVDVAQDLVRMFTEFNDIIEMNGNYLAILSLVPALNTARYFDARVVNIVNGFATWFVSKLDRNVNRNVRSTIVFSGYRYIVQTLLENLVEYHDNSWLETRNSDRSNDSHISSDMVVRVFVNILNGFNQIGSTQGTNGDTNDEITYVGAGILIPMSRSVYG
ncbi:hypothetical protein D6810_02190 [Candidatus Dojkabacteria bacterium]|uniref:Uncharacterized protein n=1 Tax=Candidatus Dojkabacteria bacterium TaxID=2099670 RepID=A0A3M0YY30_9BACT|nr:MAG: hypothetical protein D6810_02190 [Candidatus Dojkabacteria bacterium]